VDNVNNTVDNYKTWVNNVGKYVNKSYEDKILLQSACE